MKRIMKLVRKNWELASFMTGWMLLHPIGQLVLKWARP